ncbi:MAG: helix-turn-helix domain-containing protein [Bacteroidetes bacterium]|nr:helix-turn-helix domain-containing protein [Bacteroidota bacterium]
MNTQQILNELTEIKKAIEEQGTFFKPVLNFEETCKYLQFSRSHLYKLTSRKEIPHFCPSGKKLYFNREELDHWLQRFRQKATEEIDVMAEDYVNKKTGTAL